MPILLFGALAAIGKKLSEEEKVKKLYSHFSHKNRLLVSPETEPPHKKALREAKQLLKVNK